MTTGPGSSGDIFDDLRWSWDSSDGNIPGRNDLGSVLGPKRITETKLTVVSAIFRRLRKLRIASVDLCGAEGYLINQREH